MSFAVIVVQTARQVADDALRFKLNQAADALVLANAAYATTPTIEALRQVNNCVACAGRLMALAGKPLALGIHGAK